MLSEQELARIFNERMTHKANLVRQLNDYFRKARWETVRNAISGELTATCHPTGPVSVGFGKSKQYLNVSGNTIVCLIDSKPNDKLTHVALGPGTYTTLFGFYAYPATVYTFDVVKAIKRLDRDATVKYPWSIARIVTLVAVLLLLLIASSSGGSGNSNSTAASGVGLPVGTVSPQAQNNPTPEESAGASTPESSTSTTPPSGAATGEGEASSTSTTAEALPSRPSNESSQLVTEVDRAQEIIENANSSPSELAAAGGLEQLATRELLKDKELEQQTLANLDPQGQEGMRAAIDAANALKSIVPPQKSLPKWRIREPPPPPTLLSYYQAAQSRYGIPWPYLAAIQLVETRMGRIRGTSTAGAEGPMQFIPTTWARYGHGSANSFPGSIMAAARLLASDGGPGNIDDALYHYNPSPGYVRAIDAYAHYMQSDERAYYGYYYWRVLYKRVGGTVILPAGYPETPAEPIE
jgi:hypothetical protein